MLLKNEQEWYENTKMCYICKEKFEDKYIENVEIIAIIQEYRGTAHSIYNLKYRVPKEILIVFRNRSNYDYHFIIKKS